MVRSTFGKRRVGVNGFKKIMKLYVLLIVIVTTGLAKSAEIKLWKTERKYFQVSKEAISVPSVRLLDPPKVIYYEKDNELAKFVLSGDDISLLTGQGDLDPKMENFFGGGIYYLAEVRDNVLLIIFRETNGKRYRIATGMEMKSMVFQQEDFIFFSRLAIPKVLSEQMDKFAADPKTD